MKISIIGVGMVGKAVLDGSLYCKEISTLDKFKPELTARWDRAWTTDLCFVCVPTPSNDGIQDATAVVDACMTLRGMSTEGYKGVVVIKSTVLPGTMRYLSNQFPDLRFVHNPEFLREKSAASDYHNQKTVLMSGKSEDTKVLRQYCDLCLPGLMHVMYSENFEETEFAKYIHNCALPVKLSFLNEVYDVVGDHRLFESAIEMAAAFGNLGMLNKVPGPDGRRGWGGSCFTKDTAAFEKFAAENGIKMHTLTGAINTNNRVRGKQ